MAKVGETLGNYKLLRLVGRGGQGVVYQALDTTLNRPVAIKIFNARDEHRRRKLASFKYEARLASSLNHPNICTVYALFDTDEHTYIVMEYVEGKNLYELARGRPLTALSAVNVALQITDALVAAHAQGIIHRDIKPRNVMIDRAGRVVVLDFGLAKLLDGGIAESVSADDGEDYLFVEDGEGEDINDDKFLNGVFVEDIAEDLFVTVEGTPYGTPASSPPEMARGEQTDARGDVFSVGVLIYLLLTGEYPFTAKTIKEVRAKVVAGDYVPVSVARKTGAIPLSLSATVVCALRVKPEERFQTMAEMRERLLDVRRETEREAAKRTAEKPEENQIGYPAFSAESAGVPHYVQPPPAAAAQKFWRRCLPWIFAALALIFISALIGYFWN